MGVSLRKILIGLAFAVSSTSAVAQVSPTFDEVAVPQQTPVGDETQPTHAGTCELHIWPADDMQAVTQGWMWNNTVNQEYNAAKGGKPRPQTLMTDRQLALLQALDLPAMLGLAARQVVTHAEPLSRAAAAATTRNAPSTSTCYEELVVSKLFYDRAPIAGKSLKSMIVLRTFGDAPEVRSSFATWAETGLRIFPAAAADQADAADAELAAAYQNNVRKFAGYLTAPKKPKKR